MNYTTIGKHITVDFWGASFDLLNDKDLLTTQLTQALANSGVQILSTQAKQFTPYGVTVLVMLAESHASIHTYPEKGFAALDCYTCGDQIDPAEIIDEMIEHLQPAKVHGKLLRRGDGQIEVVPVQVNTKV